MEFKNKILDLKNMWKIIISTDLVVDLDVKQEMIYRI